MLARFAAPVLIIGAAVCVLAQQPRAPAEIRELFEAGTAAADTLPRVRKVAAFPQARTGRARPQAAG